MKNLKRIFLFAFTFLAGIILVSCGGTTDTPSEVITEGEAATIVAQIKEQVSLQEGLEVDSNLTLPTSFEFAPEAIVDWTTSNSAVISKDGVVNRPVYEDGNATVTLKVTITMKFNQNAAGETQYGRVQESYEFVVTVLALPRVPTNEEVANGYLAEVADLSGTHKDDFDLPVVTNGEWSVEGEGLQIVDGVAIVSQTDAEQHATLTVTVTVGDYVGTKSFEISIPALVTLHYYNSNEWTKVYIYEWSTDPRVAWPGTEVEVVDGWVHYTPSYDPTGYNYIFNNGSGAQTADIKYEAGKNYYYGLVGQGFATVEDMMAHLEANKTVIYLRGSMNNWGTTTTLEENDGVYTITIDLKAGDQFKIATADWSTVNIGGAAIKAKDSVNFTTDGENAKVVNAGRYTFTLTTAGLTSVVKYVDEAEEAQKIMDAVTVPATITNEITLPQAEGLAWAVKEGTAITIAEGVATVTQTEVEQVVVLTATATYGEASVTKDFTVTVLPLVPTDEEIANGYLAQVADLSGEYTEDVALPEVTNGVWSATGLEIVDGVLKVVQTEEVQTATLTITVTVGEAVVSKDFTITVPALEVVETVSLHYYNTGNWTSVYVYEWITGSNPRVTWPGTKLTLVDGWVDYELTYDPTGYNYIFNNGSGSQTPDLAYAGNNYFYGTYEAGFATKEEAIAHYENSLNTTIDLYVRGDHNNWGTTGTQFKLQEDGTYAVTVTLTAGKTFKVADSGWDKEYAASAIVALDNVNFSGSGTQNATVVNTGVYRFVYDGTTLSSIERIYDDNEEADKILASIDMPTQCVDTLVLPQVEGLTWSVKEGTAIVIVDGVATVTQNEVDQVVVLTATATFGSVTKTQDYTITVLPLVPSDEDIANGYLAQVADLSGEYTEDVALPEVTNGVWSATGLEIVDGVLKVVQTEEVQTATLTITITVGEAVVSKDFTITVPALEVVETVSLHYYNTGKWTSVYVYEWVEGGSERVAWPGTKLTLVDGWAEHVLTYDPTGYSYIFNNGSGSQTPNLAYAGNNYFYGTHEAGFATKEEAVAHYQSTLNTTIDLYVRGDFNSWGTTGGQFKLQEDGTYAVTVTLTKGQALKVANSGWSKEYAASAIVKLDNVNFSGSGSSNATVVNTGVYKFVYNGTALSAIERIYDDNEEADKILAAIVMPEQCQDTLVLPAAEGLTWAVKEGTAITIVDGVAIVSQGDAEQVVVLTATATFRSVTKTQDYTVVVLPAVISDEEQAQIYLDEATDVTGTYKTGFALQAVTNGVWSVTGEGAAIDGDNVVITRTSADQTAVLTLTVTVNEVVLTKEFTLTIPKIGNMLYMKPNSNWTKDGARFAAYFFVGSTNTWLDMVDSDGDGVYEVEIPEGGYTGVIFCRMNPSAAANNWNNKWNQTGDLTIANNIGKKFVVPSGSWDGSTTGWTTM